MMFKSLDLAFIHIRVKKQDNVENQNSLKEKIKMVIKATKLVYQRYPSFCTCSVLYLCFINWFVVQHTDICSPSK
jgi:hypothetical protein